MEPLDVYCTWCTFAFLAMYDALTTKNNASVSTEKLRTSSNTSTLSWQKIRDVIAEFWKRRKSHKKCFSPILLYMDWKLKKEEFLQSEEKSHPWKIGNQYALFVFVLDKKLYLSGNMWFLRHYLNFKKVPNVFFNNVRCANNKKQRIGVN